MVVNGSIQHMVERINERVGNPGDREIVIRRLRSILVRMTKRRDMPNCTWYAAVTRGGRKNRVVVGYICGQGNWFSTVLGASMVPKGTQL